MSIENKLENREADQEYNDFVKEHSELSGKLEKLYDEEFDKHLESLKVHGKDFWLFAQRKNLIDKEITQAARDYAYNFDEAQDRQSPEAFTDLIKKTYKRYALPAKDEEILKAWFRNENEFLKEYGLDNRLKWSESNVAEGNDFQVGLVERVQRAKDDMGREIDEKQKELQEKNPELWERYQVELKQESDEKNRQRKTGALR